MKILQVIPYFTPKRGGDVNVCYNLSKFLAQKGHNVTIITTDFEYDPHYAANLQEYGITIYPFFCRVNFGLFLYSPSMKKWLKSNLHEYDIVHLHDFRSYQNAIASEFAKKFEIPFVLQAHGDVPYFEKSLLKKTFDLVWGKKILKRASKAFALSEKERMDYNNFGIPERKIDLIPNGIDLSSIPEILLNGQFRSKYNISPSSRVILYLGRLHKIKGLDLLIDAFSECCKEMEDLILIILGPDEDGTWSLLEKQVDELNINDKVRFLNPIYGKEKFSAYRDSDIFVLPSIFESFPTTILEAWACGTPVITTNKCAISEMISLTSSGIIVERTTEDLKKAIVKLITNISLQSNLKKNGEKVVRDFFTWDKIVIQIEQKYTEINN